MRHVSDKFVEKMETLIFVYVFWKSCLLLDNVEKLCTAGQATDKNMTHMRCMVDT
jgi:hypothetical protein